MLLSVRALTLTLGQIYTMQGQINICRHTDADDRPEVGLGLSASKYEAHTYGPVV